jgi:hypothetical protein
MVLWSDELLGQTMLGDDQVKVGILRSSIGASFSMQPTRSLRDFQGSYSYRSAGAEVTLPVYETRKGETDDKEHSIVLLRANASIIDPEITVLAQQHKLVASSIGLTYGTFTSSRMDYALALNAGIAEDEVTIHEAHVRFTGFGLSTSHINDNSILIYGLAYTYTFDRGRLFPLLGLRWRFAPDWDFHVLLPLSIQMKYRYTNDVAFGMDINVHGNRFRFSDEQFSDGRSEVLNLRMTELQFGVNVNWKLKKEMLLQIETGITTARKVYITSSSGDLFSSGVKPSPFLTMKLRFILSESAFQFEDD